MGVRTDLLPARYRDVRAIGHGGMGEIYRARDDTLDRTVAVKLLAERYAQDDDVRRRFKREALTAARLSGEPGVVTIFDVGEWNDRPFIVMEHLDGGSLDDVLRSGGGALPPSRVLPWIEGAARALDAAHANGVVHRDVKPGNLLLDRNGNIHVGDFGIASAAGLDSLTKTGTVLGTVGYLSPEGARGERTTPASDRYALAVVAYELLAGRRPFEDRSPTAEALGHVQAPVPPVSTLNRDLPPELDGVFERALAKDPDDRFPTAAQFAAALRRAFAASAGTTAERTAVAATPTPGPRDAPTAATPRPVAPVAARRRRSALPAVLVALLVLGLVGVALGALVAGRDDGSDDAAPATQRPRTVERTITTEGEIETVTVTTTTPAEPPPSPPAAPQPQPQPSPPAGPPEGLSGPELNDRGFALMQQGRYEEALPYFERANEQLAGSGQLAEAYTLYNLAYTRLQLGNCEGVLDMLNRSERIQGQRGEIDRARAQARSDC